MSAKQVQRWSPWIKRVVKGRRATRRKRIDRQSIPSRAKSHIVYKEKREGNECEREETGQRKKRKREREGEKECDWNKKDKKERHKNVKIINARDWVEEIINARDWEEGNKKRKTRKIRSWQNKQKRKKRSNEWQVVNERKKRRKERKIVRIKERRNLSYVLSFYFFIFQIHSLTIIRITLCNLYLKNCTFLKKIIYTSSYNRE